MNKLLSSLTAGAVRIGRHISLTITAYDLRRKIEDEMTTLGRKSYELFQAGALDDPAFNDACQRVVGLEEELKRVEAELRALRVPAGPRAACPKCGARVGIEQAFCVKCGGAISHCSQCHNPIGPEARFCPFCGKKLEPPPAE